ncbi:MAG: hypothetical protein ACR2NC_02845 [Thermodesulfobacteriota bacterium]
MKISIRFTAFVILFLTLFLTGNAYSLEDRYKIVIEESFYVVAEENKEEFIQIYKSRLFPFWQKMKEKGIIVDDYRMYSQRIHTLEPLWTFKTVVKFKNYQSIDKWLENRDKVYNKMFPGEGGYKGPRKQIDLITEAHWDEFIREIPLS